MAQKSKATTAAKQGGSKRKSTSPVVKAVKAGGKIPAKGLAKAASKPVKTASPAKGKPAIAIEPKVVVEKSSAKPSAPQIAKAKAALKKESKAAANPVAAPAVPEKPAVKARSRKITIDASPNEAASALAQKWMTLYKKAEQIEAKPYNMKAVFEEKTAIMHKVLGWGYILANRNDRLEVLFKDGIKYLISNYKP